MSPVPTPQTGAPAFGRQHSPCQGDPSLRIAALEKELKKQRELLAASQKIISAIYVSREWKIALRYRALRGWLLPAHSRRRRIADFLTATAIRWFKRLSLRLGKRRTHPPVGDYRTWIAKYEPGAAELERQRHVHFEYRPRFSIVVGARHRAGVLHSLQLQTYDNWALCQNASLATGDFMFFLDEGDVLAPFALFQIVQALQDHPDADLLYSDEDRIDASGVRSAPIFKPDWSPDALRSGNCIGQLAVFRTNLLRHRDVTATGYDRVLCAAERAGSIVHVPGILIHRQQIERSLELEQKALADHLERMQVAATVQVDARGVFQVRYQQRSRPLVSILIPSHDQQLVLARCLQSIQRSSYANHEIVIVENHSQEPATFAYYRELERRQNVRVLTWEKPFSFAAVNNFAAGQARGDVLLFLNNDVQAINPDWLERLLEQALRPEVGAVGAKLYYPDETVQHGGILLGVCGIVGHAHRHFSRASAGYCQRLVTVHNVSAVTGACLMMRRDVFQEIGGFDERLVIEFNDLDLCLKARERGYWIVWTPHAELYHWESKTRGNWADTPAKAARFQGELDHFLTRWGDTVAAGDPFYNRHLSPDHEDFSLRR